MPLPRTLPEILNAHAEQVKNEIRKVLPATVTAVHASRQTVDVQLAICNVLFDEINTVISEPAPTISDVPLGVMRGGGFLVWVPVAVGDSVLLVFSDLSCDTWRAGDGSPQPPGWAGKHSHDSPFAMPCVAPDAKFLRSTPTDKLVIGKDGADEQIQIGASDIELGAGASDFVALASKVATELTKIATALTSLTVTTGPGAGGTVVAGTPYTTPGSVAATLVKAK